LPTPEPSAAKWDARLARDKLALVVGDEYFAIRDFGEE
jgi:hypothetical protein